MRALIPRFEQSSIASGMAWGRDQQESQVNRVGCFLDMLVNWKTHQAVTLDID